MQEHGNLKAPADYANADGLHPGKAKNRAKWDQNMYRKILGPDEMTSVRHGGKYGASGRAGHRQLEQKQLTIGWDA